jgi:PAS domain S-box-containing protein
MQDQDKYDRSLFDRLPVGLYRSTPAGQFLDVNPALVEMLGYPDRESLLAIYVAELYVDPADRRRWQAMLEREGVVPGFEVRVRRRDGTIIWARESARAVYDAEGLLLCYEGSVEEITEHKRVEEALRESEGRYRRLFEDSPICLWEEDFSAVKAYLDRLREEGVEDFRSYLGHHPDVVVQCVKMVKVLGVNKATLKFYQIEDKDLLHEGLIPAFVPESYPAFREELVAIAAGQTSFESDTIAETVAGEKRYTALRWSAAPGHEATLSRVLVSVIDITDRKGAEEEIRRLKDFNEGIVQNMAEGIVIQDADLNLTFVNPAAAAMLGYKPEEMMGQPGRVYVPPDQRPIIKAADERRARGEADRYVVELLSKDGTRVPVLVSGRPMFRDGCFVGTLAVFTNIIERVQAEEKLTRRALEMAALYDTSLAINAQLDLSTLLNAIVQRASGLVGVQMGGLYLMRPDEDELELVVNYNMPSIHVGTRLRLGEGLSGRIAQAGKPMMVADYRVWEGRAAVYAGTPFRRVLGVPLRVGERVIGVINVTDDERAGLFSEDEVRLVSLFADQAAIAIENARLFRIAEQGKRDWGATFDAMRDAVILVGRDSRILRANRAFVDLVQGALVVGQMYHSVMADAICLESICPLERTVESGQLAICTHEYRGRFFEVQATPLPRSSAGESGYEGGGILVMRDITERIQMEEQFYQAQKMEALGQMAGGIAHDFNNLLTVIQLSTRLLQRQLRLEDPLWEHVQRIRETGERATSLTKQLLRFSRREVVDLQVLNLNHVVEDLGRMLQRIIGETIELVTVLAEDLWQVEVDPSQIDQVIVNLVVNARDAMPKGGTLTIKTANVTLDEAYVAAHVDAQVGEHVLLSIEDTGVGMDEEVKAHLFEPFFTTKQRGQGTGLGLSTVFGIVRQNRGHIRVYSEVGVGTTVRIYLPSIRMTEALRPGPSHSLPSATDRLVRGTETVLVVEDEADVRTLAVQVLQSCGYQVLTARNGLEALQISEQHDGPVHLLLTDVVMPQMSGRELADRLQQQRPAVRVLYMSGYAGDALMQNGALAAGTAFLTKPLTVEALTQKVRAMLDGCL